MKGGFQILDLSGLTVGTEAAVNNAFKTAEGFNNKAILVLPPAGGSVYCQLNKSSDNYVGAYVGADGATYNIVIKPNNNVTVTKTEAVTESELTPITSSIMSIGGQVEDLQNNDTTGSSSIGLNTTTNSATFTMNNDGYFRYFCRVDGSSAAAKMFTLVIKAKNSSGQTIAEDTQTIPVLGSGITHWIGSSIFLKKGTYYVYYSYDLIPGDFSASKIELNKSQS